MKSEGMHQEAQGAAEDRAEQAEDMAQEARDDAASHQAEREDPCRRTVGAARVRRPDVVRPSLAFASPMGTALLTLGLAAASRSPAPSSCGRFAS